MASVCGTSVPVRASMIRHSRRMPSSRGAGAVVGRLAQGAVQVASPDLEDLVLAAAGDVTAARSGGPPREALGCPSRRPGRRRRLSARRRVGAHSVATSCSRYSANFSRAASCLAGYPGAGPHPVSGPALLQQGAGHRDPVHLCGPVDQAQGHSPLPHAGQRHLVGDAERPVHLDERCTTLWSTCGVSTFTAAMS